MIYGWKYYLGFFGFLPLLGLSAESLTFFSISDTHYGTTGAEWIKNRKAMPDWINALPGLSYPASVGGGPVGIPKGLLMPGDLVDNPDSALWNEFTADYGIAGEGRTKFPVFDGLGNHDGPGTNPLIVTNYQNRNRARQISPLAKPTHIDSLNYNYSWDWGQVHFINLNLYSGSIPRTRESITAGHSAYHSLDFLKADLEKYVGNSRRPVFIMQHYSFDGTSLGVAGATSRPWWLVEDGEATYQVLKNYNVIGLLHGHSHGRKIYKWNGIDVFDDGTAQNGDLFVFRITEGRMFMANRVGDAWGTLNLEKAIDMGKVQVVSAHASKPKIPISGKDLFISGSQIVFRNHGGFGMDKMRNPNGRLISRQKMSASHESSFRNKADQ
jgi:hypothetical protein